MENSTENMHNDVKVKKGQESDPDSQQLALTET